MKHDPLCSEGEVRGDQVMDCDCAGLIHQPIPDGAETEPRLSGVKKPTDPVSARWDEYRPFDSTDENRTASASWHQNRRVYFCGLTLGLENIAYAEFANWDQARQFCEIYMETGRAPEPASAEKKK